MNSGQTVLPVLEVSDGRVVEVGIDQSGICKLVLSQVSTQFGLTSKVLWSSVVQQVMPYILLVTVREIYAWDLS